MGTTWLGATLAVVAAFFWGATEPLLKKYGKLPSSSKEITPSKEIKSNCIASLVNHLFTLFSRWQYTLAFLLNQLGGPVFLLALAHADLSLAVGVANGLKFVFNFVVGRLLNEASLSTRKIIGLQLILVGVLLQLLNKG